MLIRQLRSGRFPLGRVLSTPGVLLALGKAGQQPQEFLDAKENEIGLRRGLSFGVHSTRLTRHSCTNPAKRKIRVALNIQP